MLVLLAAVLPQCAQCSVSCDVWVDGGCGSIHYFGEEMNIYFEVNKTAYVELYLTKPDGTRLLTSGDVEAGVTYSISGVVGEPAGERTILLETWSEGEYDSSTCIFYGYAPPGFIQVESTPSGADVYLDGDYQGTTPLTVTAYQGGHTLFLTYPGYYDERRYVEVNSNETTTRHIYLRVVFWRTWYFAGGIAVLFIVFLIFLLHRYEKQPISQIEPTTRKFPESTSEVPKKSIEKADFVSIDALPNIDVPDEAHLCPINNDSLENGEIIECTRCEKEGFTCRMHRTCWEKYKAWQRKTGNEARQEITCPKQKPLTISEERDIKY